MSPSKDNKLTASVYIIIAMAVAASSDALLKLLSADYPIHEINTFRYLISLPFGLAYVVIENAQRELFHPKLGWILLRSSLIGIGNLCFTLSVAVLTLADAVAIYFTMPFFVAGIVPFFLGEKVGIHRWLATIAGFLGVMIMIRPGASVFEPAALLALASAFLYGSGQVITRQLGHDLKPAITAFWQVTIFTLLYVGLAVVFGTGAFNDIDHASMHFLTREWVWPSAFDFWLIVILGVSSALLIPLFIFAYSLADASFVAPFEYTSMFWAVLWGFIMFGDRPDSFTITGVTIVIAAGIYMLKADHRVSREKL